MFRIGVSLATTALQALGGGAPPGGGILDDKLVLPASRAWMDTVAPGQTVTTISDYQEGATYAARLIGQANRPAPPADALVVAGGAIQAGAGYASLRPAVYILEIENQTTGFFTHALIRILSNKPANYTATTPAELTAHLNTIQGLITSQGAAFPGAIIDIAPGDYGDFEISQVIKNNQVNPVILRPSSTDRVNGARPRFQRITLTNTRYVTLQSLWWESYGVAYGSLPLSPMIRGTGGSGLSNDFTTVLNPRAKGGMIEWNGSGLSRVNPALDINPADQFSPVHTCLKGQWSSTTFTRLDLYVGHTATEENGAALGVWKAATVPAYVGPNTPDGTARVFTRTDMAPVVRRASDNAVMAMPGDFDAEFEVAFLTSTPVATINGGVQSKPAGGPDGNYIVAWRLVSGGTWTGADTSQLRELNMGWVNQATYENLPTFMAQESNGPYRHLQVDSGSFREIEDVFRLKLMNVDHSFWLTDNQADCIARDFIQVFWNIETSGDFRIWGPDHGLFTLFNRMGRPIVRESDWKQMHGDYEQHAADWNTTSSSTHIQTHALRVGGVLSARSGRLGAGFQGPFGSDMFRSASGYRDVSLGNFIDAGEPNAWTSANNSVEQGAYNSVITRYGASNVDFPTDAQWLPAISRQKSTYGALGTFSTVTTAQQYLDHRSSAGNGVDVWLAPDFSNSMDYATLRARFTAVGANAGFGAFADQHLAVDQEARAWNPNVWEFRMLVPGLINQPLSTRVRSIPRQLLFGTKPFPISITNGLWSKGATPAAAIAATPTSAPGTLSKGEWIVIWVDSSSFNTDTITAQLSVNGIVSPFPVRTEVGPNLPPPQPGLEPTVVTTGGASLATAATVFDALAPVSVPDGGAITVFVGIDGEPAIAISGTDTDWELVASVVRAPSNFTAQVYQWKNRTGAPVNKSLQMTFSGLEQAYSVHYVFDNATTGFVVETAFSGFNYTASATPNPPFLGLDANRRHVGIAGVIASNNPSLTTPSTGFPTTVTRRSGTSSANVVAVLTSWGGGFTNNNVDPDAMTISASQELFAFTMAVWEQAI